MFPDAFVAALGPIVSVETPPQGGAFHVVIVATTRGRFVVKRGATAATRAELADESRVLDALRGERLFVAAPVGFIADADMGAFAFTYIQGETMIAALRRADDAEKHALVARFDDRARTCADAGAAGGRRDRGNPYTVRRPGRTARGGRP